MITISNSIIRKNISFQDLFDKATQYYKDVKYLIYWLPSIEYIEYHPYNNSQVYIQFKSGGGILLEKYYYHDFIKNVFEKSR